MRIVYYSGPSENTKRFVEKFADDPIRLPLTGEQPSIDEPYVLVCPTYGGGAALMGRTPHYVPVQVKKFLRDEATRNNCAAVIACGNRNFGADYGRAGREIGVKLGVPVVLSVELAGTAAEVEQAARIIASLPDIIDITTH